MKELLLLAIIHLLIFHQYSKDKKELLSPQKIGNATKAAQPASLHDFLLPGMQLAPDSLLYSWLPLPVHNYISSPYQALYHHKN
jgi:hypothetical protein